MTTLRGFAIPYGSPALLVDGVSEVIAAGAFRNQIQERRPCRLLFGSHDDDAPVLASEVSLFETAHGLAFEADVNPPRHSQWMLRDIASGGYDKCSVYFEHRDLHVADFGGIRDVQVVTNAEISHIAIMSGYTTYAANTGCWLADHEISGTNHRLQLLAEKWEATSPSQQPTDDYSSEDEPRYQELLALTAKARGRALAMFRAMRMQNENPSHDHQLALADDADDLTLVTALLRKHKDRITDLERRLADMEGTG